MFQQKIYLLAVSTAFLLSLAVIKPGENFPVSGRTNPGNLYCPEPPRFGELVKKTVGKSTENTGINDQSWLDEVKKNIQKEEYDFFLNQILEEEVYTLLKEAIDSLPGQMKRVYELALLGHSNEEIAKILSISVDAVKALKKRGKKILQEKYLKLKTA